MLSPEIWDILAIQNSFSVFPSAAHVNPFFVLPPLSLNPCVQEKDFFLLARASRRWRGRTYVVNTKVIQYFIESDFSPLGPSHNYTHSSLRVGSFAPVGFNDAENKATGGNIPVCPLSQCWSRSHLILMCTGYCF